MNLFVLTKKSKAELVTLTTNEFNNLLIKFDNNKQIIYIKPSFIFDEKYITVNGFISDGNSLIPSSENFYRLNPLIKANK